jgi:hypothetical protein
MGQKVDFSCKVTTTAKLPLATFKLCDTGNDDSYLFADMYQNVNGEYVVRYDNATIQGSKAGDMEKDIVGGHYGFDYAVTCAKELAQEYVKFHENVVKVVLKTGVGEKEVKLDDASITKLEACVDFAAKVGGVIELYGDSSEPLPGWSWRVTHLGVRLANSILAASNNIETKKFRKMLYGGDVEGFEKLEDGTYVELD